MYLLLLIALHPLPLSHSLADMLPLAYCSLEIERVYMIRTHTLVKKLKKPDDRSILILEADPNCSYNKNIDYLIACLVLNSIRKYIY